MQVTETLAEGLKREFKVVVEAAAVQQRVEARLAELGQGVKIPGFRPGKVPAAVLRQRYGKEVLDEVVEETLNRTSQEALKEKSQRPAMPPKVKVLSFEEGKPLEYSMTFENLPEMPAVDFAKLSITKLTSDVTEKEVEEGISRLAQRFRKLEKVEKPRKAVKGDVVGIDFLGKVDGVPFDGGKAENFQVELGSGQLIPGFEDQVEGMKPGESKVINVTFPEDYGSENLAGKAATFDITLNDISAVELPPLDDELAKKIGVETMDKLKELIKGQIEKDISEMSRVKMKRDLFDALEAQLSFDIPKEMFELEFNGIWQKLEQAKQRGDASVAGKSDDELKEEYTRIAERRVRLGLFLADVGAKNNVKVSNEELTQAVMQQARQYPGQEQKVFEFYRKNPAYMEDLKGPLFEDKAVDYVLTQVTLKPQAETFDGLLKAYQGEDEAPAKKPAKAAKAKPEAEKAEGAKAAKPAAKKKADNA